MGKWIPLSPKQKGQKAAHELKTGKRICNDGEPKKGRNGQQLKVTKTGRSYRSGYLDARKDISKAAKTAKKVNPNKRAAYNSRGRVNEGYVDDLHGSVTFFDGSVPF